MNDEKDGKYQPIVPPKAEDDGIEQYSMPEALKALGEMPRVENGIESQVEYLFQLYTSVFNPQFILSVKKFREEKSGENYAWRSSDYVDRFYHNSYDVIKITTEDILSPQLFLYSENNVDHARKDGHLQQTWDQLSNNPTADPIEITPDIRKEIAALILAEAKDNYKSLEKQYKGSRSFNDPGSEKGSVKRKQLALIRHFLELSESIDQTEEFLAGRQGLAERINGALHEVESTASGLKNQVTAMSIKERETLQKLEWWAEAYYRGFEQKNLSLDNTRLAADSSETAFQAGGGWYQDHKEHIDNLIASLALASRDQDLLRKQGYDIYYVLRDQRPSGSHSSVYELFNADGTVLLPSKIEPAGRRHEPPSRIYNEVAPTVTEMGLAIHSPSGSLSRDSSTDISLSLKNNAGIITPEQLQTVFERMFPKNQEALMVDLGTTISELKKLITKAVGEFNSTGDNKILNVAIGKRRSQIQSEESIQIMPKPETPALPTTQIPVATPDTKLGETESVLSERSLPIGRDYVALLDGMRGKNLEELRGIISQKGDVGMSEIAYAVIALRGTSDLKDLEISTAQLTEAIGRLKKIFHKMPQFSGYTNQQRQTLASDIFTLEKISLVLRVVENPFVRGAIGQDKNGAREFQNIFKEIISKKPTLPEEAEIQRLIEEALEIMTS